MFRSVMLRFVLPVAFASCVVAYFGLPYIERLLAEWFRSDVELRSQLVMHSMEEPLSDLVGVGKGNEARLRSYLAKVTADERLLAILVCRPDGTMILKTERTPSAITCGENAAKNSAEARVVQLPSGSVQVSRFDFDAAPAPFRVLSIHNYSSDQRPVMQVPASGMVTALEPIMRACAGTWIAHGAGLADRETVDRFDQIRVPPDDPAYTLRRVWLTPEQEQGYYYGFSNEGLWPLCHLAYVRPAFRPTDWHSYAEVNERFADVVAAESNTDSPVILIQDFHFALLPQLIRRKIPKATIALFWHIPWPNA